MDKAIEEVRSRIAALKAEEKKLVIAFFNSQIQKMEWPEGVDRVEWCQYTPYFNDGDECVFGVHDVRVISREDLDDYGDEWFADGHPFASFHRKVNNLVHSVVGEEILRDIFGDHVEVTITRGDDNLVCCEASHYDHD